MSDIVSEPGKIRGRRIMLGSQEYIIPPLNLIGFEEHEEKIEKLATDQTLKVSEKLRIISGIALSALQRNYPEVDMTFLKKWVDLGNMEEVFSAVMAQSGMRAALPGEATASGSTGQPSTLASAPQPAGNGSTSAIN